MSKFPGCMLANDWEGWPARGAPSSYVVEPKLDGYRLCTVIDREGKISFYCRKDEPPEWAEHLGHIRVALMALKLKGMMIDGEIAAKSWNATSKLLRRKRSQMSDDLKDRICAEVVYHIWDIVDLDRICEATLPRHNKPQRVYVEPFYQRRAWLERARSELTKEIRLVPQFHVKDAAELAGVYETLIEHDYEGAIIKHPDAPYVLNRSHYWLKLKPHKTIDLKVTGMLEGRGKYLGMLGSLVCESADGGEVRVGGMTDAQRRDWWQYPRLIVGRVIEVKAQDSSVSVARHPEFLRIKE